MANILIASLGESPVVVTAMVKKLQHAKQIQFDRIVVLYPAEQHPQHASLIEKSVYDLILEHCLCQNIDPVDLPFYDANTVKACRDFLQTLYAELELFQTDAVYLSLAGGRKSMSVLMALLTPFYQNIQGLYHILDTSHPDDDFPSLQDLFDRYPNLKDPALKEVMNPPVEQLKLIELPLPHFCKEKDLPRIFQRDLDDETSLESANIYLNQIPVEARDFWAHVFQRLFSVTDQTLQHLRQARFPDAVVKALEAKELRDKEFTDPDQFWEQIQRQSNDPKALAPHKQRILRYTLVQKFYTVWLSENAKTQLEKSGRETQFARYFSKLTIPVWANKMSDKNGGKHLTCIGKNDKFYIAKIGNTAERVAWHFQPEKGKVVIAELAIENQNKDYQVVGGSACLNVPWKDPRYFKDKTPDDYPPRYQARDFSARKDGILVATVGKSPMVVTQAYRLLQDLEKITIRKVVVIYPAKNGDIRNGVATLKAVFAHKNKKLDFDSYGVELQDIATTEDCKIFLQQVIKKLQVLKQEHAESEIHLLLSGGRKGMSALAMVAAQQANILNVYHTLITDPVLEAQIERAGLKGCNSDRQRAARMFLDDYSDAELQQNFALFKIPVIPFNV